MFRYLGSFHDEAEEAGRWPEGAFIPAANDALRGLGRVNAELVGFAGRHSGHTEATLDVVRRLRRKLGDDADSPTYIITEPRVGYRMLKKES